MTGIGAEKRQCFSPATAFGAPKSGPKTLQIPGAAILTLPRPCEATNRPTGANTGLHLYLWRRPRLLLKLSGKIAQTHAVLLLAERLHFPSQYLLLGSIQVIAPVLLCAISLAEIQLQRIARSVLRDVVVGVDIQPVIVLVRTHECAEGGVHVEVSPNDPPGSTTILGLFAWAVAFIVFAAFFNYTTRLYYALKFSVAMAVANMGYQALCLYIDNSFAITRISPLWAGLIGVCTFIAALLWTSKR